MPQPSANNRQRLIRLIHVAKRDLQMDDDSYRAVLSKVAKKTSAADLTVPELERTLEYLKRCGFKVRSKGKPAGTGKPAKAAPSRPMAQDPEAKKIRALWLFLHDLGAVQNPSEEALAAYVKRIAKVDALQWINGYQAETLIESMKKWAMRFLPEQVKALAQQLADAINAGRVQLPPETIQGLRYTVGIAQQRQTFDPMQAAWEDLTIAIKKGGTQ